MCRTPIIRLLIILLTILGISEVRAQDDVHQTQDTESYSRAFFERYFPQTARDMVDRVPGFTLDSGDDLRGFGSGAGNVLIDGQRPVSKSGGVEDALERISADAVERIDVIRGTAGASEAAGQSLVINIIRVKDADTTRWEGKVERAAHGRINIRTQRAAERSILGWATSSKTTAIWNRQPLDGTRISRDADDVLTLSQTETRPSVFTSVSYATEARRNLGEGDITLTALYEYSPFKADTTRRSFFDRMPDGDPDGELRFDFVSTIHEGEFGADWNTPLTENWSLNLISIATAQFVDEDTDIVDEEPIGAVPENSLFESDEFSIESVLRGTVGRTGEVKFRPEAGVELAYNRVSNDLSLRVGDGEDATRIILPAADVVVEELRGEAFLNLIWQVMPRLKVESGLGGEYSSISVSGDADNSQTFAFLKPFVMVIFDAKPDLQFRLGARRSVGQLAFDDFAASASVADDRFLSGNPALGPDQTWRAFATVDVRRENKFAANVEVFHEWRDDILEQIILPSGDSGLGNAGSGRVWGVTSNAAVPLNALLKGALLEVEAEFLESEFFDPLIGANRDVSNIDSPAVLLEFRQDLTDKRIAWGGSFRAATSGLFFFTDEESFNRDSANWTAFAETNRFGNVKMRLEATRIGGQEFTRRRRFFTPDRSFPFAGSETIETSRGAAVSFIVEGQF